MQPTAAAVRITVPRLPPSLTESHISVNGTKFSAGVNGMLVSGNSNIPDKSKKQSGIFFNNH